MRGIVKDGLFVVFEYFSYAVKQPEVLLQFFMKRTPSKSSSVTPLISIESGPHWTAGVPVKNFHVTNKKNKPTSGYTRHNTHPSICCLLFWNMLRKSKIRTSLICYFLRMLRSFGMHFNVKWVNQKSGGPWLGCGRIFMSNKY